MQSKSLLTCVVARASISYLQMRTEKLLSWHYRICMCLQCWWMKARKEGEERIKQTSGAQRGNLDPWFEDCFLKDTGSG